jgi:3-hydroxyisobutyrate dehydrogenase
MSAHAFFGMGMAASLGRRLKEKNIRLLGAPVSGGDIGAQNASLIIMVGRDCQDFPEALPVLKALGENIFHCDSIRCG